MAGSNGTNGVARVTRADAVLDLDALVAGAPDRFWVKVEGVEYAVRQIAQLTGSEELDLAALDRAVDEARLTTADVRRAMFDRVFKTIRTLVPTMPERVILGLTFEQATALTSQAWRYATEPANPPATATPIPDATPEESSKPEPAARSASTLPS